MGEHAARITAAEFVTPPEFARLHRARHPAGRIGGVRLALASGPTGSRLGPCYQQVPLRVLPLHLAAGSPLLVYLINPTAGLMDGDAHLVQLDARPGTRAVVVGQSASRIHPCLHEFAMQQWRVRVASGAVLLLLPGPAIPFHGCRYYQRADLEVAEGAGLVWGDVWLAGRYARDEASERFRFNTLVQDVTIRRENHLVYRDRFVWRGPWDDDTAHWHFGSFPAYGSLWISGALPEQEIGKARDVRNAVWRTAAGDTVLRWLGPAETVTGCVVETACRAAAWLEGRRAPPWLLAGHDLAPVHWFRGDTDRRAELSGANQPGFPGIIGGGEMTR